VAFAAQTTAPSTAADSGIWAERPGMGLQPLILEGDLAPGAGSDVRFANLDRFSLHASFGSAGDVALRAGLAGPAIDATNDSGIWLGEADGNVRLIAREGQPAPGVEAGVTFSGLNNSSISLVNAHGLVAFLGLLTGPGINASNDRGIWAETADGELKLIARQGAIHQTASGAVQLNGLSLGEGAFSDSGHIAFLANLTASGRSAVFVSSAVAIPEPATAALGLFVVAALARRRRQSTSSSPHTL
jgi:MYXO-CTERM domain-containing protein